MRQVWLSQLLRNLIPLVLAILIASCGGGSSGGDDSSDTDTSIVTDRHAYFIDSEVQGILFSSPSYSGITDTNGGFPFIPGETTTFSYFGLQLGSFLMTTDTAAITPFDLLGASNFSDQSVKNLLVLLQSLDTDQNPANGIGLIQPEPDFPTAPINNLDLSSLDLSSANFQTELESLVRVAIPATPPFSVVAEQDAIDHFQQSLTILNANPLADRWIYRDSQFGDVNAIYDFFDDGKVLVTEFEDCANNTVYWAASEASANANCTTVQATLNWLQTGNTLTMSGVAPDNTTIKDTCIIISSTPSVMEENCQFTGWPGSEKAVFERSIPVLNAGLIDPDYIEVEAVNPGDVTNLRFNTDGSGSYELIGATPNTGGNGNFTWTVAPGAINVSGTDDAGQPFSTSWQLVESVRGALSTNNGNNLLIPEFKSGLASAVLNQFHYFSVYDALSGQCKGARTFTLTDTTLTNGIKNRGVLVKDAPLGNNPLICDEPLEVLISPNSLLTQIDPPLTFQPEHFGVSVLDNGSVHSSRDAVAGTPQEEVCWPISFSLVSGFRHYLMVACSIDNGPFEFEIWQGL